MTVGERDSTEALAGPFTTHALLRLREVLCRADQATGLTFSLYVGDLADPTRTTATALLARLPDPNWSVLIAVSPQRRQLEIVTGGQARKRLPDRDCKLAALSMAAAFSGGDLSGGVVSGISQLADHAGRA